MKAKLLSLTALFVILSFALAQDMNLRFVGTFSNLGLHQNYEQPFWGETVPEGLEGVTTEVTTFDQMGLAGGEVFRLLDQGLFDIGATVGDYVVSDAPAIEGLDLPLLAPDIETAQSVAESYKPVLDAALQESFDAKLISVAPYPSQIVFCNTEIGSLEDLEGLRIRASGRSTAEFLEAIGAAGVTLAFNEVPQALQQGVVDCAVTGSTSGYSAGWADVATHLYTLPAGGWDYVITAMQLEVWDQLSAGQQETLMTLVEEEFESEVWGGIGHLTQQGINCLTGTGECELGEAEDMTLVELSEGDIERGRELLLSDLLPAWASRVDAEWVERWNDTIGDVTGLSAKNE